MDSVGTEKRTQGEILDQNIKISLIGLGVCLFVWLWDILKGYEFQGKCRDNCIGKAEAGETVD